MFLGQKGDTLAEIPEASAALAARPKIALALGGGGARGFAHIGVLRVLLEAGFDIEVIAGTSIGAVVGGSYAADRLDRIEEWARGLTRRRVAGLVDMSLRGGGLIGGARLGALLARDLGSTRIENLRIPFAAVATEIATGHEVWLTRGPLVPAIRASYALPGVFEPVQAGGRWLMDGALANPVPVTTARALGGRCVIAINLCGEPVGRAAVIPSHSAHDTDLAPEESPRPRLSALGAAASVVKRQLGMSPRKLDTEPRRPRVYGVMLDAFNITQDRISRSRLAGDPPDVMVVPRLARIGLFDFHRADEIIAIGADATRKRLADIVEMVAAVG